MPPHASAGGLGQGFPWARYYDLAHGNPISDTDTDSDSWGGLEGRSPSMHAPPRAVPSAASMWRAETESAAANGRRIPEWYTRGRV